MTSFTYGTLYIIERCKTITDDCTVHSQAIFLSISVTNTVLHISVSTGNSLNDNLFIHQYGEDDERKDSYGDQKCYILKIFRMIDDKSILKIYSTSSCIQS